MKQLLYILAFTLIYLQSLSQHKEESGVNLPKFYRNKMHFGFALAYNKTDFRIHTIKNSELPDTVIGGVTYGMKTIYTKSDPGFALGIITDFRLHQYIRLRFTPNISFASRSLEYKLENAKRDSTKEYKKSVESTFLIFPLELKLQSKRLDNFGAYVILGGGYSMDLVSKKKPVSSGGANQLDDAVQLKRDDFFYSGGAGVDFYLQYFKLGLELKVLQGTKNLKQPLNNIFTNSLEKVNSKMVIFSITFEG
ncbi:MAG: outer membrane beta-barrel protein [Bacteroidetes bacterium]|nr:outer membrane beta-barrel protein [Bacteroidota bacterium]